MNGKEEYDELVKAFHSDLDGMLEGLWLCLVKNRLTNEDAKDVSNILDAFAKRWRARVRESRGKKA